MKFQTCISIKMICVSFHTEVIAFLLKKMQRVFYQCWRDYGSNCWCSSSSSGSNARIACKESRHFPWNPFLPPLTQYHKEMSFHCTANLPLFVTGKQRPLRNPDSEFTTYLERVWLQQTGQEADSLLPLYFYKGFDCIAIYALTANQHLRLI